MSLPSRASEWIERAARRIMTEKALREVCYRGWAYVALVDHRYIDGRLTPEPVRRAPAAAAGGWDAVPAPADLARAAGAELARLAALTDVATLSRALDDLTRRPDAMLRLDSGLSAPAWPAAGDAMNVVIIGAGPIGLGLASALKLALATRVNVLVVENRVVGPHEKAPYTRHWLTAVVADYVRDILDDDLRAIFATIGGTRPIETGPVQYIGVALDVLESLLLLSCRRMGVDLLFGQDVDLAFVGDAPVHLVFDATGNHLHPVPRPDTLQGVEEVETRRLDQVSFDEAELRSFGVVIDPYARWRSLTVGSYRGSMLPIFMNQIVRMAMVKALRIPIRLYGAIMDQVRPRNGDHRFYVWPALLHDAVNEILLVVSLEKAEYEHLCRSFTYPLRLDHALEMPAFRAGVDRRFVDLVRVIVELATPAEREQMVFDAPFLFQPYFRDIAAPERIHGKPLIRVGDSLFNGHVKAANGLGPHLVMAGRIQGEAWHAVAMLHAEGAGAAMAAPRR